MVDYPLTHSHSKYSQAYRTIRKLAELLSELNERVPTLLVGLCDELLQPLQVLDQPVQQFIQLRLKTI